MGLLDLSPELVTLIIEHIGIVELRTSTQYLLVSKLWYRAALPVYLSDLQISTIYLSSHDLELFPPLHSPLNDLIAEKVERLSVRFVGHPSKQIAKNPWYRVASNSEDGGDDEELEDRSDWDYWMRGGPAAATGSEAGRKRYLWHTEEQQLRLWRRRIDTKLLELSDTVSVCKNLKELSVEASSEYDPQLGPRWDYLLGPTMMKTIMAIPSGLNKLTLDTCGSTLVTSKHDRSPMHLCSLIALRLQDFEEVRIRMRHICPQIFDTSNGLTRSRLRSLVIRLSLPSFPEASYEKHDGCTEYDVQACNTFDIKRPLHKKMILCGIKYAKDKRLDMLRINYKPSGKNCINLYVADCVRGVCCFEPSDVFTYEDDGRAWEAWEDADTLQMAPLPF